MSNIFDKAMMVICGLITVSLTLGLMYEGLIRQQADWIFILMVGVVLAWGMTINLYFTIKQGKVTK